jgi:hypothetical protein
VSDATFAAILTLAFFSILVAWAPILDSVVRVTASLKRRRTAAELNRPTLFVELKR